MSNTKTIMGQASNQYVAPTDITDVFSTYLYYAAHGTNPIVNDINLADEGGMVWFKNRTSAYSNVLFDTERGIANNLVSNTTAGNATSIGLASFNTNGFSFSGVNLNVNSESHVAWTFRKAPKFFDIVTYTGNSTAGRTVSHNLGVTPGMIIVKRTDSTGTWYVYHRGLPTPATQQLQLNTGEGAIGGFWNGTAPTSTEFSVGDTGSINGSGRTFVAYLFAHNNSDGGFGPNYDQDIIKCGSFTGGGDVAVDVGFEPQFVLAKRATATGDWFIHDTMRGFSAVPTGQATLEPNTSDGEGTNVDAALTTNGFRTVNSSSGQPYIYMAIRRGSLSPPTAGTEVFAVHKETTSNLNQTPPFLQPAPFAVDFISNKMFGGGSSWWSATRLTNARLQFESTAAETSVSSSHEFDHNDGVAVNGLSGSTNFMGYMWKRAPSFFDVVAYTGNSTAGRAVSHNLTVTPEMIWVKNRGRARSWIVYHTATGNTGYLKLNETSTLITSAPESRFGNGTVGVSPTASNFTVATNQDVNYSGDTYISYLFSSLAGVSKVGSVSHVQYTDTNVDCGFTSGARFVLLKRTNTTGDWWVFDTARGIAAGDDKILFLNSTAAEFANDSMSPLASGFTMVGAGNDTGDYIFYAIA